MECPKLLHGMTNSVWFIHIVLVSLHGRFTISIKQDKQNR